MKSRSEIWLRALEELGAQCSVSTTRDAVTLARRVEQEGDTFFKVALPKYAKDLEQSLAQHGIPTDAFHGFKRRNRLVRILHDDGSLSKIKKHGGGIPLFLGGFLDLVFCDEVETTWDDYNAIVDHAEVNRLYYVFPTWIRPADAGSNTERRMAEAIRAVRQLCNMFGKEKELCSDSRIEDAVTDYVKTDVELELPFSTGESTGY